MSDSSNSIEKTLKRSELKLKNSRHRECVLFIFRKLLYLASFRDLLLSTENKTLQAETLSIPEDESWPSRPVCLRQRSTISSRVSSKTAHSGKGPDQTLAPYRRSSMAMLNCWERLVSVSEWMTKKKEWLITLIIFGRKVTHNVIKLPPLD